MANASLSDSFESDLKQHILDEHGEAIAEGVGGWVVETAEEKWRRYAQANDYDIDHVWEDVEGPETTRVGDDLHVRIMWPFSSQFEFGVDPHVIEASDADMLAFPWPEMEGEEFGDTGKNFEEVFAETWPVVFFPKVNWGSRTGGIPKARAVRDMLRELRREANQ